MVQARDSRPRQGCPLPGTACCHHTNSMHYPPHWVPSPLSRKSEAATAVGTVSETGTEPEGLEANTVEKQCVLFTVTSVLRDTCSFPFQHGFLTRAFHVWKIKVVNSKKPFCFCAFAYFVFF